MQTVNQTMCSKNKILTLGFAGLLLAASPVTSVLAQSIGEFEIKNPEKTSPSVQRANDLTKWMQKNLTLTLNQFTSVSHINLLYAHKEDSVDNVLKDHRLHTDALNKLKKAKDEDFREVLTEIQYKQYIEHKEFKPVLKRSPFAGNYLTE